MLKTYFTLAWRNLQRNTVYSLINIAGLSIGLACAMLIMLYVKDEASYDRFHVKAPVIHRVVTQNQDDKGEQRKDGNTGYFQGPRFAAQVPEIESFVRVQSGSLDMQTGSEVKSQRLMYVDSNFFSVFSFPLVVGDRNSCLDEPHSVVLSEDMATKQFGSTDVFGRTVMIKQDTAFIPFKVTAVAKRSPQNSSIKFDLLLPLQVSAADEQNSENWFNFFLNTFVVLHPGADTALVNAKIQQVYLRDSKKGRESIQQKFGDPGFPGTYFLQPFLDMHMSTELPPQNGLSDASNPMYSYILTGIALFVLLIACINFVNLTVARSVKRAKEIGIRKVIGGRRQQLIYQFMGESFLLCTLAFLLAIGLVQLVLPIFNELSNKVLALSYLVDAKLVAAYLGLFIITGLLAGFYPALVLSAYKPVDTLYSRFNLAGKNYLQRSLVVLQFTLASFMIIATLVIYQQFNFLTSKDLGYDDNNIIQVNKNSLTQEEAALFTKELMKDPNILAVAPKNDGNWQTVAKLKNDSSIQFSYEIVDEQYLPLFKIPVATGRNFSREFADANNAILVNESFVKAAGWQHPIGETVNFWYDKKIYTVVGVVKDYHFASLDQTIIPQLFSMNTNNGFGSLYIKIKPNSPSASLAQVEKTFKQFFPLSPYTYSFKDEENRKHYENVQQWKQILLFGAVLTIFISCIGLFGLTVLAAQKRTKEIGIRKVLGSSVQAVVFILSKDFLKLVLLSILISTPLAWLAANRWLENYPYRIHVNGWLFAFAGFVVIFIAMATISFQAVKAAVANPVKSLRTE